MTQLSTLDKHAFCAIYFLFSMKAVRLCYVTFFICLVQCTSSYIEKYQKPCPFLRPIPQQGTLFCGRGNTHFIFYHIFHNYCVLNVLWYFSITQSTWTRLISSFARPVALKKMSTRRIHPCWDSSVTNQFESKWSFMRQTMTTLK